MKVTETHKAALAATHLPKPLLERVGVLAVPEALDGDDMLPVDYPARIRSQFFQVNNIETNR